MNSKNFVILFTFITGLFVGLYFNTFHLMGFDLSMLPGDFGDSRLNNYFLEHCHLFFSGKIQSFWDAPFMFPEKSVISFSDNLLGTAPFYSFFRIIGLARPEAYQLWVLLMAILNYAASYLFFFKLTKNPYGSALGAFVFAFSLALMSQVVNTQMYPRFPIPLTLLMLYYFIDELKPRYFFFATLLLVYQFYCVIYLGFILAVPYATMILIIFIVKRKILFEKIKSFVWWRNISIGLILNVMLLLILMIPYLKRAEMSGTNSYESIFQTIPTINSYFFSAYGNYIWQSLSNMGKDYPIPWIHTLFAGAITLVSYILFFVFGISKLFRKGIFPKIEFNEKMKIILITSVIFLLLFTRFGSFSLYKILFYLPGFGALRNLCRMISLQLIFYGLAVAFIVALIPKKNVFISILLFLLVLGALVVDNYTQDLTLYRSLKSKSENRIQILQQKMQNIPPKSLVSYEPDTLIDYPFTYHIDAMLASQHLDLKCVNGYSGNAPSGFYNFATHVNKSGRLDYFNTIHYSPKQIFVVK